MLAPPHYTTQHLTQRTEHDASRRFERRYCLERNGAGRACAGAKTLFLLESVAELEVYNVPLPPTDGLAQQRHAKQRRASQTKPNPNQVKSKQNNPKQSPDKQAESPDMHRERGEHANAEITRGCTSARALRMLPRQSLQAKPAACTMHGMLYGACRTYGKEVSAAGTSTRRCRLRWNWRTCASVAYSPRQSVARKLATKPTPHTGAQPLVGHRRTRTRTLSAWNHP
jgi:hypothetical protein